MKKQKSLFNVAILVCVASLLTGCLQGAGTGSSNSNDQNTSLNQSSELSKLSFKATSQSGTNLESSNEEVLVQVKELEVLVAGTKKAAKVILKKDIGVIDLMKLNQGVLLDLFSLNISEGTQIKEIRLRLKDSGHYYVNSDGIHCELKTPSAQQSGLKLKLPAGMRIEAGYSYNVVMGFNPKKSIVLTGNGGCLLKPVIRIERITRSVVIDGPADNGDGNTDEEQLPVEEEEEESTEDQPPVEEENDSEGPVEGVDYIIDGNLILIPQEDGSYLILEGVDLTQISIEEVLASLEDMN